jgi:hypothetical protein
MKATANLKDKTWSIDQTSIQKRDLRLEISFFTNGSIVEFKNLSFGVLITKGDQVGIEEEFPKNGAVYVATDQDWLERVDIFVDEENQDYQLKVWAINNGEYFEDTFILHSEQSSDIPIELGGSGEQVVSTKEELDAWHLKQESK